MRYVGTYLVGACTLAFAVHRGNVGGAAVLVLAIVALAGYDLGRWRARRSASGGR